MTTQTKVAKKEEKAVVKWKGEQITVTFSDVKNLICPLATDQETAVFLKTCQSLNLNPFASEIYLIKYSEREKAAIVVAIDSYLKSAESNNNFNGHEAGIVLRESSGRLDFREGALLLPDEAEKLAGGWARVYRKDREKPFYMAVNKAECVRFTREGKLTRFWTTEKQPSMLRKTALKRALVEAFPSLFSGAISTAEIGEAQAEYREVPEGELPPAYQKPDGEADWRHFWARQGEKGLAADDVHQILQIQSLKDDWLGQGKTLEEAEEVINGALERGYFEHIFEGAAAEEVGAAAPTKVKPKQAEWRSFWEHTERLGLTKEQVYEMLGTPTVAEWTEQGKTLDEAIAVISEKLTRQEAVQPDEAWDGITREDEAVEAEVKKPKRDPEAIKTINELMKACFEDFKLQPKDVLKELGYSSQVSISELPADCYRRIVAGRG